MSLSWGHNHQSVTYQLCPSSSSISSWLSNRFFSMGRDFSLRSKSQRSKSPLAESGERRFWCVVFCLLSRCHPHWGWVSGSGLCGCLLPNGRSPLSHVVGREPWFPQHRLSYQDFMSTVWSSGENTCVMSRHRVHKEEKFLRAWRRTVLKRN